MKIFTPGELILADEINQNLNPAVAPNIPYAVASGVLSLTLNATAGYTTAQNVTFPTNRFTVAPSMTVSITHGGTSARRYTSIAQCGGTTRDGSTIVVTPTMSGGAENVEVTWTAIQMTK